MDNSYHYAPRSSSASLSVIFNINCSQIGTVFEFGDVFCFTDFLSGFLFRVRVRVKVGVGGGFRVRVRASVRDR